VERALHKVGCFFGGGVLPIELKLSCANRVIPNRLGIFQRLSFDMNPNLRNRSACAARKTSWKFLFGIGLVISGQAAFAALGEERLVEFHARAGGFPLVVAGQAAPLLIDSQDYPGAIRAANDLEADITRVTGISPKVIRDDSAPGAVAVIIGTVGRSRMIDALIKSGKIDGAAIAGKWESFLIQVVDAPAPGIERGLVIAGSDKRGTIYGVYDLSEQIGVSPWYWWADVPAEHHDTLVVQTGRFVHGPPSVKYRGIFLNDEAPDLTNWVKAKFGTVAPRENPLIPPGIANYGHEFYAKLFEVMLRLRANYLWPAMWNNAFNEDDPENARLADEYGIVMGTSHQEPMLRAQHEWDRRYLKTIGHWNYARHPDVLEKFWRDGIRRNRNFESIVTVGLRGANDTEMAPGGPAANRALLEKIVGVQRNILREEMNPDVTKVPQLWCLYKEVQDYYEAGMRAPDDVTLLWAEDNWGNIRRLPTAEERQRSGGAGVYYHFDYHGGPRSYQWINTSPIPKIWEQLSLAKQYGADRIWIVNVGHFKGYEFPIEYFLSLAWDTNRWTNENFSEFTRLWAEREFGSEHAADTAEIMARYSKYNGRRKPESLSPHTYSLTDYNEAEKVVADFKSITAKAEKIYQELPAPKRDAFYELVLFPTKASALVNELYLAAGKNELYAKQGRASTNDFATETRKLFQADLDLMAYFNDTFAGGRWAHFMDQSHLGYKSWRDPPRNSLDAIKLTELDVPVAAAMGVVVEGSAEVAPASVPAPVSGANETPARPAMLPKFDAFNRQRHYVDIFNKGKTPFGFTATASDPWIVLSETNGVVNTDRRIWVSIDWNRAPKGNVTGTVKLNGTKAEVIVALEALNPVEITRDSLRGFIEGEGVVSIEPEHYSRKIDAGPNRWIKIEDYGRTLSGMRANAPADAPAVTPGTDAPCLEYRMYLFSEGAANVIAITAPTMNFIPGRAVRYAISFDDEIPTVVTLVPAGYKSQNGNRAWEKSVLDNAHYGTSKHTIEGAGYHTLKIWMVDPAVVMQKIVVDLGGLKPSYLGPPESFHSAEN